MTALHALLFGFVEGITEFLPISSTAHLILTADLLKLSQTDFLKSFEIAIQLGAILSVVALYWKSLLLDRATILRVIAGFIPTGIIGFLLHTIVLDIFFDSRQTILWALFLGGIVLIAFEKWHTEKSDAVSDVRSITFRQAAIIGCFQSLAIVPGVSRAAATVIGGLSLGLSRKTIVDFSFLLAVPTMLAATGLDLVKSGGSFSSSEFGLLAIGFVTSFVVAIGAIKWLLRFIQHHSFTGFGVYRILIAVTFWFAMR